MTRPEAEQREKDILETLCSIPWRLPVLFCLRALTQDHFLCLEPPSHTSPCLILPTLMISAFPELPRLQVPALHPPSWYLLPLHLLFMCGWKLSLQPHPHCPLHHSALSSSQHCPAGRATEFHSAPSLLFSEAHGLGIH